MGRGKGRTQTRKEFRSESIVAICMVCLDGGGDWGGIVVRFMM